MEYGPAPESNSDVQAWLDANKKGFGHFINGKFTGSEGRKTFAVINPANARVLAKVAHGTAEDVDAAVKAARKRAFGKWSKLPGHERAKYLYAIARHIQKHERFFSVLETMDNGKPIRETRDIDIPLVARHFYHHAGWAQMRRDRVRRLLSGRRVRAGHPVEFPAADAGVEDRSGVGSR